ncbi:MAG: hypothetical protein BM560_16820 [Roseobacter sp. MedPE-SWde]|nr:MAG: hypothetical protein BM560_16820 [Roseobacter sp. MedPE-SWde]
MKIDATTGTGAPKNRPSVLRRKLARRLAPNGHQAIAQALKTGGITHVYSLPGNPVYATLAACVEIGLVVVGCRSQSGALSAAMAHNYQAGRFCALALCSPAPGVTNSVTALSDAMSNQWPMVLIAGVVEPPEPGQKDQGTAPLFQSFDGARAAAPCCKAVMQLQDRAALTASIHLALEQARSRPRGPVFVEVGLSVLNARHPDALPAPIPKLSPKSLPKPLPKPRGSAQWLSGSHRPILILGEDLRWGGAPTPDELCQFRALLEELDLPVLATDMGRGILPDGHRLSVFLAKEEALQNCDHVLLCGADLDWRFSARSLLGPEVPIEPLPLEFEDLLTQLAAASPEPRRTEWVDCLARTHAQTLVNLRQQAEADVEARQMNLLCEALARWGPENAVTIIDSGLGLASGHNLWPVHRPFSRMTPGQNGTIGLGIPFALGAAMQQLQLPVEQRQWVVALVGDVGFGLSASELETAQRLGTRLIVVVADNGGINGPSFQNKWFPAQSPDIVRYGATVDYAQVARGWGARGVRVHSPEALQRALSQALSPAMLDDGATVISVSLADCFGKAPADESGA